MGFVVAIDGPAASGKGSIAGRLGEVPARDLPPSAAGEPLLCAREHRLGEVDEHGFGTGRDGEQELGQRTVAGADVEKALDAMGVALEQARDDLLLNVDQRQKRLAVLEEQLDEL